MYADFYRFVRQISRPVRRQFVHRFARSARRRYRGIKLLLRRDRPWMWLLWHPHQGLWNWDLLQVVWLLLPRSLYKRATSMILLVDTGALFARVLGRRVSKTGLKGLASTPKLPEGVTLLYFDLGTHKGARELDLMVGEILPRVSQNFEAYGFEASRELYEQARTKFVAKKNVIIIHGALCQEPPSGGKIKLFKDDQAGIENSIYRHNFAEYEEVEAIKFSDWLRKQDFDLDRSICLLRMNIEGAEFDVVSDLISSNLHGYIDGYFGMWDDVSKIDRHRDEEFRALLAKNHISTFPFNERDFEFYFRLKCIEYEVATAVYRGLRKL